MNNSKKKKISRSKKKTLKKNDTIRSLTKKIEKLKKDLLKNNNKLKQKSDYLYAIPQNQKYVNSLNNCLKKQILQQQGKSAIHSKELIKDYYEQDFNPRLNTSSYVNVAFEPEEEEVALLGLKKNLADQTVYPKSFEMHNDILNIIGNLWNCPKSDDFKEYGHYSGAGTVGSTEACLLAGLALKFRWRKWYAARHKLSEVEVRKIYPNLVISTCYQSCWEKLFKYMDIEPKLIQPSVNTFTIKASDVIDIIDDKTIGVVCIMGNHYGGQYDPVWEIDKALEVMNSKRGFQVGIHVDAASGGFVAPFQKNIPAWDFRCKNVLSISTSGHKFGESCCGTGWIIWRQRKNLSEYLAIQITYLGGKIDSYTLNFSRPASGVYVQFYKFNRLGIEGYKQLCDNMMNVANIIRNGLKKMTYNNKKLFIILDNGNSKCLPVVSAMLNPELKLKYDDIDLQYELSKSHWYVSGYRMMLLHPITNTEISLFNNSSKNQTMFRIVVKSNITIDMGCQIIKIFNSAINNLNKIGTNKNFDKERFIGHSVC